MEDALSSPKMNALPSAKKNLTSKSVKVPSEREYFDLSGPLHLFSLDWNNGHHRRSVAASLVQSVYILERDRQENRTGLEALALPWWEFFHFELVRQLVDDEDKSIFGAIFEYNPPEFDHNNSIHAAPVYVVSFRGTITKGDSLSRDMSLNLQIIQNGLHLAPRFQSAMQAVREVVASSPDVNIWLTGHSLGAAMAMLAGKTMAKNGTYLDAYLFNPPFFSAPIESIGNKKVRHGIRIATSFVTAGLLSVRKKNKDDKSVVENNPNDALAAWAPYLYVNPADHICAEYVGYFEHRKKMEEIGAAHIERLASQNSIGGLLMSAMGKDTEAPHLIPSANLNVSLISAKDFKEAHGIHQWWRPDLSLDSKLYQYQ